MFLKSNLIAIVLAVLSLCALIFLSGDLEGVLALPIIAKINNIFILFSALFIFLRLRDKIIGTNFNFKDIKNSVPLALYYSITFFAIALAISLILM